MTEVTLEKDPHSRKIRIAAMITSLILGIFILGVKFYAARIANSAALRSDALEGMVNVMAAAFGLGAIFFAEQPADKSHPYGHGKIEYFSSVFEGGLIALAGGLICIDVINRFIHPRPLLDLDLGLKLNVAAGVLNGVIGVALYTLGKKFRSQILVSDGIHLLTDLLTTVVLCIGLGLVLLTGWTWLDPILAIAAALFLFKTGFVMVRHASNALLDAEDPELMKKIVREMNHADRKSIIAIHEVKLQQFGRDHHIDLHVVVPEFLSIKIAHDQTHDFAMDLHKRMGGDSSHIHTHIDPCNRGYCKVCPQSPCPIRKETFVAQPPFTLESITELGDQ